MKGVDPAVFNSLEKQVLDFPAFLALVLDLKASRNLRNKHCYSNMAIADAAFSVALRTISPLFFVRPVTDTPSDSVKVLVLVLT
jgi:hypothetical protein